MVLMLFAVLPDPFAGKLKDALMVLPVSSLVYDNEVFFLILATLISPHDLLQRLHEKEFMTEVHGLGHRGRRHM